MQFLFYRGMCNPVCTEQSIIQCKSCCHIIPTRTIRPEGCSPPLTPLCNGPSTLIRKYMTVMLYTIIFVVYLLFLYLKVKKLGLKALNICLSLVIFRFSCLQTSLLSLRLRANGIIPDMLQTHCMYVDRYYYHNSYHDLSGGILDNILY